MTPLTGRKAFYEEIVWLELFDAFFIAVAAGLEVKEARLALQLQGPHIERQVNHGSIPAFVTQRAGQS